jgi:hypothetical protein
LAFCFIYTLIARIFSDLVVRVGLQSSLRVKLPNTVGLVSLETATGDLMDHGIETRAVGYASEESTLPFGARFLFSLAQLTLLVLDERLLGRGGVHITTVDGLGDLVPGAARLERVLLFNRGDSKRGLLHLRGVVRFDNLLVGVLDDKVAAPLALGVVDDILFATVGVHCGGEGVLLAADPALAAVVNLAGVASGRDNVSALLELNVRRAGDETLDVKSGEGDEVVFVVLVDVENGVTNLLDVDSSTERGLLSVVTLETNTVLLVPDAVSGNRGVVARLVVREERNSSGKVVHT